MTTQAPSRPRRTADERTIDEAFSRTRSYAAAADEAGATPEAVRARVSAAGLSHLAIGRPDRPSGARWPAARVVDSIRAAAAAAGVEAGGTLTAAAYSAWRAGVVEAGGDAPTVRTVFMRLGGWREACAAAGLTTGPRGRAKGPAREDDQVSRAVREYCWEAWGAGRRATISGYDAFAKPRGLPSRSTVQARHGSWAGAARAAAEAGRPRAARAR